MYTYVFVITIILAFWVSLMIVTTPKTEEINYVNIETQEDYNYVIGTGSLSNTLTVYNRDSSVFFTATAQVGHTDSPKYIAKFDKEGKGIWYILLENDGNFIDMKIDSTGNIYVCGYYQNCTIYNSDGSVAKTFTGTIQNGLLAKFDKDGYMLWFTSQIPNGGLVSLENRNITIDYQNNVYISGIYTGDSPDFYNQNETVFQTTLNKNNTLSSTYIAKYDMHGRVLWVSGQSADVSLLPSLMHMDIDSEGNNYLSISHSGQSQATFNIYNNDGSLAVSLSQQVQHLLLKYTKNGTYVWNTKYRPQIQRIRIDSNDNILLTGFRTYSLGAIDFYNQDGTSYVDKYSSTTDYNASFITKYNNEGYVEWIATQRIYSVTNGNGSRDLQIDKEGNIYITGNYTGTSSMEICNKESVTPVVLLTTNTNSDTFLVKYNDKGNAVWGARQTDTGGLTSEAITFDSKGDVYTGGSYDAGIIFYNKDGKDSGLSPPSTVNINTYIVKYDKFGNALWFTEQVYGTVLTLLTNDFVDK